MRIHAVGVGAIGVLLSFHLKRTARRLNENASVLKSLPHPSSIPYLPSPYNLGFILRLRKHRIGKRIEGKPENHIVVERDNAIERESGFGVVEYKSSVDHFSRILGASAVTASRSSSDESLPGISRLEELGYAKGSIDAIIVTTKAQNTVAALRPLVPQITSATTIVLLQNGQGVLDLLFEKLFTDPSTRPHFILASTTHGAYTKNKLHSIHAAFGKIDFGIVPNRSLGKDYERLLTPLEKEEDGDLRLEDSPNGQGVEETNLRGYDRFLGSKIAQRRRAQLIKSLPLLDINAIPNTPRTQTLLHTMSLLLNLPLAVTWQPIRNFQLLALKKLVVNACINPVTTLVECRNGDLFGNKYASQTIRQLCAEISLVLEALAQKAHIREENRLRTISQQEPSPFDQDWSTLSKSDYLLIPSNTLGNGKNSGISALDPSLRASSLVKEVQRVAQMTAPNYSSMFQDIKSQSRSTEIDFINGYFSRLGRSLGVATPINDLMVSLIQLKTTRTSTPWTSKM